MKILVVPALVGLLLFQMALAQEKPADAPQAQSGISQESMVQEFEKQCTGFMEKLKACEAFSCTVTVETAGGTHKGTNTIKGKGEGGTCQFEMMTVMADLPPLTYRCKYSEKTHAVVVSVMEKQLKNPSYSPEGEERRVLADATEKECILEGEEAFVRALDARRNEMMQKAKEKIGQMKKQEQKGNEE